MSSRVSLESQKYGVGPVDFATGLRSGRSTIITYAQRTIANWRNEVKATLSLPDDITVEDYALYSLFQLRNALQIANAVDVKGWRQRVGAKLSSLLTRHTEGASSALIKRIDPDLVLSTQTEWLRRYDFALVQNVTGNQERIIRNQVDRILRSELTTDQAVKTIKNVIGLNERQANALTSYSIRMAENKGAARFIERYHDKLLTQRAAAIAATESYRAANAGQQIVWENLNALGRLPDGAIRVWKVSDNPCSRCKAFSNVRAGIGESFVGSDGMTAFLPPLHTHCRCTVQLLF